MRVRGLTVVDGGAALAGRECCEGRGRAGGHSGLVLDLLVAPASSPLSQSPS